MNVTDTQLQALVAAFLWPMIRISALFVTLPIFSVAAVTPRIRLLLSMAITFLVMPLLPKLPEIEVFSYTGLMVAIQQLAIGLVSGFILQIVFAAVVMGGQGIANSMGLGFASMIDPQDGQQVPVVSQLYVVAATLIFLSVNAHLLLIEMLVDSFKTLPISTEGLNRADIWRMLLWSKQVFSVGLLLALPVTASLLFINISFGVATRAAPQLQIFSVGFPVTIFLGLMLIWLTLPQALDYFAEDLLLDAYDEIKILLKI